MIEEVKEIVKEVERELMRLIRVGVVTQVLPEKGAVRVKFADLEDEVSYELPVLVRKTHKDKDYWLPDVEEQVVCLFFPYGTEQGFVIGAFYSEADKVPVTDKDKRRIEFEDESYMEYDRKEHKLKAGIKGEVEVEIEKDGVINIKGNAKLNVEGNVELVANGKVVIKGASTVEIDGGGGAVQKPIHDASPCPLFGCCHLIPSNTIKISP